MDIFLLCFLIAFSVLAIFVKDLMKAALSLAAASIFLAMIFFRMSAPYAGVFEVSVVAGLIMILFISVIALTKPGSQIKENRLVPVIFAVLLVIVLLIDLTIMGKLCGSIQAVQGKVTNQTFGEVLWSKRTFDLVGQTGIIFAGVFVVLALFRTPSKKE